MNDLARFEASLADTAPPPGLPLALLALWHAGRGEWAAAHGIAQAGEGEPACDWVHAYLHRQEGDLGNARYWYRRADRPEARDDLKDEWGAIAVALLGRPSSPT